MATHEINFDGLVGPTHHYGGLSEGNVASMDHGGTTANPRAAALQGLDKMLALAERGWVQGVLPPLRRPNLGFLRALGFTGSDAQRVQQAYAHEPALLGAAYSASSMWAANAATVAPCADTPDGRVHFTPANLNAKIHRAQEHAQTAHVLRQIFHHPAHFVVHDALPSAAALGDEGAANHTRFASNYDQAGVHLFVFGRSEFDPRYPRPTRFVARQTLEASRAVARLHGLPPERVVYLQQNPLAIDQGVFHHDVIGVGNLDVFFYHEDAFADETLSLQRLRQACEAAHIDLRLVRVARTQVGLDDAVASYLFNSQLLAKPNGHMLLLVPSECRENAKVSRYLDTLVSAQSPVDEVLALDLRQSMHNGGGPACLRLRVVLTDAQQAALSGRVIMDRNLHADLSDWIKRHYRDRLTLKDLTDPQLMIEVNRALTELATVLKLPGLYETPVVQSLPTL